MDAPIRCGLTGGVICGTDKSVPYEVVGGCTIQPGGASVSGSAASSGVSSVSSVPSVSSSDSM